MKTSVKITPHLVIEHSKEVIFRGIIMEKNCPPKIGDTWYFHFRGKFMENLPLLQDGEYL